MVPFTTVQFFGLFASYNAGIWPAQLAAYALGIGSLVFALRGGALAGQVVAAVLAAMWLWTGVAYHLLHFTAINRAAWLFGVAFLVQGTAFVAASARGRDLVFAPCVAGIQRFFGLLLIICSAVLYPLLGRFIGHPWAEIPAFGVTPCPLTIFTFGMLLLTSAPVPWWLLVIPALWAVIGGSAAVLLAVPQDWLLLLGGLPATAFLVLGRRQMLVRASASS
ncbi:DUF6064 family protein [Falsiroseomonas tokyonensis]|uniref:DUF6064 family protein n=1 Tax=Falsiroseomonas tokyonensis TaxID=430521 RepID=A0ABV7C0L7_9PROT|nr:DUF6064 family protein [Falsiroseomonas tokyonensis]MBU8541428.1 hypothetical protein [Falsiroseomonas tokyonensis]